MDVTIWAGTGKRQFGVRVGVANRSRFFSPIWRQITVEMGSQSYSFQLSAGFWKDCPEFRDGKEAHLQKWLGSHDLLHWPKGRPPQLVLEPLGGNLFRLLKR